MLMVCNIVFQGVIVGQVSVMLLRSSVKEQNKKKMKATLDIIRHYNLPSALQVEVLSFQWHSLNSTNNVLQNAALVLDRLPPVMKHEIMVYVKIEIVSRVPMFATA
eukprot:gene36378-57484_t